MDNITHSLVGAVLAQTGLKRKTRKATAALILGANAPDIDVFFGWVPWLPLATHRGFTHGVIGALIVMPIIVAGFLWLLDRFQQERGKGFEGKPAMDFGWLLGMAFIGNVTHPLLDLQTSYAVQLLSPFSTVWYHADTLFIIDLFLWLVLGVGFWLSRSWEKRGGNWHRPALGAMGVVLAYIGLNSGITAAAKASIVPAPERLVANPPPFFFWRRDLTWLDNAVYHWVMFDPLARPSLANPAAPRPANMSDPLVAEAIAASPAVAQFLRWSFMPFAVVQRERCRAVVTFNDARYSQVLSRSSFEHVVVLAIPGNGCP